MEGVQVGVQRSGSIRMQPSMINQGFKKGRKESILFTCTCTIDKALILLILRRLALDVLIVELGSMYVAPVTYFSTASEMVARSYGLLWFVGRLKDQSCVVFRSPTLKGEFHVGCAERASFVHISCLFQRMPNMLFRRSELVSRIN